MSIHQPRYSIYKMIDQLTLLSKGEIVYHGKQSEAKHYFSSLGMQLHVVIHSYNVLVTCTAVTCTLSVYSQLQTKQKSIIRLSQQFLFCAEYERDPEDNPADFFLDTIITNEVALDVRNEEGKQAYITDVCIKFYST